MDIANLGVSIDPSRAIAGTAKVKSALREIATEAKSSLGTLDAESKKAGESIKKTGSDAQASAAQVEAASRRQAEAAKKAVAQAEAAFRKEAEAAVKAAAIAEAASQRQAAAATKAAALAEAAFRREADAVMKAAAQHDAASRRKAAEATKAAAAAEAASKREADAATKAAAASEEASRRAVEAEKRRATEVENASKKAAAALKKESEDAWKVTEANRKKSENAANKMSQEARRGVSDFSRGILDMMDGVGLMDSGIGRMIRRSVALSSSLSGMANGFRAFATGGHSAASSSNAAGSAVQALEGRLAGAGGAATSGGAGLAGFGVTIGVVAAAVVAAVVVIGTLIAAFTALSFAASLVKQSVNLAGPVQLTTLSLTTMTGSATEAARVMKVLREQSMATGASLEGSSSTAKRFMALGFTPDDAIKLNKSILDVAGSIGMSQEEAKGLGAALAQVQAKGVVSMEELRQQIAEKGVPVFDELAKKMKVTTGALIEMVGKGEVPAKKLIDIFLNLEGGFAKFAGGAEKTTRTFPGAINRLKAVWEDLLITMGTPIAEAITPMINKLSDYLQKLAPIAKSFGETIATGLRTAFQLLQDGRLGEVLAAAVQIPLANVVSWLTQALISLWGIVAPYLSTFLQQSMTIFLAWAATAMIEGLFVLPIRVGAELLVGMFTLAINSLMALLGVGFTQATNDFQSGGDSAAAYIGTAIKNYLGQAMEDVINIFYQGIMNAIANAAIKLAGAIGGALSKLPGWMGGGPRAASGPAAPVSVLPLDVFTPTPNKLPGAKPGPGQTGDPTADLVALVMSAEKKSRPYEPMGPPKPYVATPMPEASPLGGKGGGKGDKEAKIPKAKVVTELDTEVQRLIKDWTALDAQMDSTIAGVAESMSSNMTSGIMSLVNGTKDLKTAFSDMANSIISDIATMVLKMYVQLAVAKMLQAAGYGGSGGAGMSVGGFQVAHTGGVAGSATMTGGIASFHTGGASTAESMVKVERGETILTKRRAAELEASLDRRQDRGGSKGRSAGTTIVNVTDQSQVLDVIAANPDAIVNAISRRSPAVRNIVGRKERQ